MKKLIPLIALILGLAIPAMTLADDDDDDDGKGCSQIGTWFGVVSPENLTLTGVTYTAMGKSENRGTNILEQANGDPTFFGFFPSAVRTSSFRGNWERAGNGEFVFTLTGYAVDPFNQMVGIVRFRGDVTHTPDCQFEYVTAMVDIYYPPMSPFVDEPAWTLPFPGQWAHRTQVELP